MAVFRCESCENLNLSKKEWNETHYCYRYGCKARPDGFLPFWLLKDAELKNGGCSDFKEKKKAEQLSLFDKENL